ncbi:MAG: fructosamine kinase family protein [Alphaproteobacteria bacterium]|nr:fructosamine kinase family protein [Alphaproteobacteria bacterium]MBO4642993.1 fructosamine kinase family protein [Alphaproteobacteria bacterium]
MQVENNPLSARITQIVESSTGKLVVSAATLAGGFADAKHVVLSDGSQVVVKLFKDSNSNLAIEGAMMDYLKRNTQLPMPEVFYSGSDALVHEYIVADGTLSRDSEPEAAEHLAKLHEITSDSYGFEFDTMRAGVSQPNAKMQKWVPFFVQNRLLYMAKQALDSGNLPVEVMTRIEKFAEKADAYLDEPEKPSLLHGDITASTVLCYQGKIKAFVDPAIFFGDPEFEFVFAGEQSSLSKAFYDRYNAIRPFRAGFFEYRQSIYNLYPMLLNVKLFGAECLPRITAVLSRFGC